MFGRKPQSDTAEKIEKARSRAMMNESPSEARPEIKTEAKIETRVATPMSAQAQAARNSNAAAPRNNPMAFGKKADAANEQRKLTVGRDITLAGEIAACDVLVVEGTVQAKLKGGRTLEVSETGVFRGAVEIDEAIIAGRFEGELTVRGRLTVRATGRIAGSIRYAELEVQAGAEISGEIAMINTQRAAKATETLRQMQTELNDDMPDVANG